MTLHELDEPFPVELTHAGSAHAGATLCPQDGDAMAAFTLDYAPTSLDFGRSGYNKDDEDKGNKGRSGYNKDDEDKGNKGRSGYNKSDDESGSKNKGRSGYN
ncbi:hypothetical protein B0I35DRAFT_478847 [Stachybotrys elegans]|uniref:Uncharacterized protein n=1 Tax=Stachybotrys elegans TaxID=80388 RepID=A0A8K0SNU3_9HYPO|nr:hypothetical protein B0I35DRAFT_478847 [Stachybotrys elegans]